jgi:hypothetical protein
MATERLKFRCYRCSQLLSVPTNRVGRVVSCPKCKADLLIPSEEPQAAGELQAGGGAQAEPPSKGDTDDRRRAEPQAQTDPDSESQTNQPAEPSPPSEAPWAAISTESPPKPGSAITLPDELAAMIPPDLVDLRPEDLRVEAEFFQSLTRRSPAMTALEPSRWQPPELSTPTLSHEVLVSLAPARAPVEPSMQEGAAETPAAPPETIAAAPSQVDTATSPSPAGSVVPPIEIEPPTILAPGTEIRRVSEVTLPASVVLAWSLFVLAGVAMSFIAGLMIGHYLWRIP